MMNQVDQMASPRNPGDMFYLTRVMLFITLLCMGYALSRPKSVSWENPDLLLPDTTLGWPVLLPWQRKASEKAVQKYAEVQEKKWQHWNEAMFERS